ncbi:hypothetical protein HJFPF1_11273 [Paramyrothecium foliicola]|nr:hypothetical protein HJFPF1_11273 [Paramyrothecium foliicola]
MVGRRRRASTSSVETVNEDQIQWLQESSVIRLPQKTVSTEDWPIFELRNATVLNKNGESLENALHVAEKGPFTLRGNLIVEDAVQRSHLIMRIRSSTPLEVRNCVEYSIGETEDGRPLIWVRGRGAWYELEPSSEYQPIYNKMCEATTLYYHMMDIYKDTGRKKSKKSKGNGLMDELSDIFLQYAVRVGDGSTFEDVVERCGEHAFFFIWQFSQENPEHHDWKATGFYKWLLSKHPDLFKKAQNLITNPPKPSVDSPRRSLTPTSAAATKRNGRRSVSSNLNTEAEIPVPAPAAPRQLPPSRLSLVQNDAQDNVSKPGVPAVSSQAASTPAKPASVISIPSSPSDAGNPGDIDPSLNLALPTRITPENEEAFSSVLASLEWVHTELAGGKKGLAVITSFNKIYFAYKFPEYRKGAPGGYRKPVEEVFHYNSKLLLLKIEKQKYEQHEIYSWLQEIAQTPLQPVAVEATKFPYLLVPRGTRKQPAATTTPSGETRIDEPTRLRNQNNEIMPQTPRGKRVPGQRGGKKSSLRLATTSQKRSRSAMESDSETETVGAKRSHYFSEGDDDMDDAPGLGTEEGTAAVDEDDSDKEPIRLVIQAERLPSTIPLGPNGTWTCEEEECDYIVRGGDEAHCQARIRDHFHEHERAARLNLAVTESRGHLPIKYAFFPPFLILVHCHDSPNTTTNMSASSGETCPPSSQNIPVRVAGPSASALTDFRQVVAQ